MRSWFDDGAQAAYEEIMKAVDDFNGGVTYNPFDWVAYIESCNGDVWIRVEKLDGSFIAQFEKSPVDELNSFMQRLEEGLE